MTPIEIVRGFLVENFLFGDAGKLEVDKSFIESGVVDSTGILELVAFLEEQFGIKITDEEIIPENLDSLRSIDSYLARKLDGKGKV